MAGTSLVEIIRARFLHIQSQIAEAAKSAGRVSEDVTLVVVTKAQSLEVTQAAITAGAQVLGENYPEQAVMKTQDLRHENKVKWHMIGHVQSRKARMVAENFDLLHSLDSLKLAKRLDRFAGEIGRTLPVLLEFNVGGEASKFGWDASDETLWQNLRPDVEALLALSNLEVRGLMTMPPFFKDAERARPYFRQLWQLRGYFAAEFPQGNWAQLSMGTSGDFQVAIQEGATYIRVGQAIVGARSA